MAKFLGVKHRTGPAKIRDALIRHGMLAYQGFKVGGKTKAFRLTAKGEEVAKKKWKRA